MSDIHGCYDDMIKMLEQIAFTDEDTLILAGDYIDRGSQSFEMLKWIESNPRNVIFLRGNHDEEFAYSIDLMYGILSQNECSKSSQDDTKLIYELLMQLSLKQGNGVNFFTMMEMFTNHMMKKWIVLSTISIADVHPEIEGQMRNWHA